MRSGTGTISGRAEATGLPGTILLSVASSMVWALLAYELVGATAGGRAIWGGVLASPLIGALMGVSIGGLRLRSRKPHRPRVLVSRRQDRARAEFLRHGGV
jgi:hypothetical protein